MTMGHVMVPGSYTRVSAMHLENVVMHRIITPYSYAAGIIARFVAPISICVVDMDTCGHDRARLTGVV